LISPCDLAGKYSDDWSSHPIQAWIGVGAIFTFVFTFGLSFGPMGWLIPAEVHSSSFRSKGVALATCTNWMSNFVVVSSYNLVTTAKSSLCTDRNGFDVLLLRS
jgi:hypothetical protein